MEWLQTVSPVWQALFATLFTWGVTALGAALVFFFKSINKTVLNGMLGFAAGVMIAASFWSLLAPAIEMADKTAVVVPAPLSGVVVAVNESLSSDLSPLVHEPCTGGWIAAICGRTRTNTRLIRTRASIDE